MGCMIHAIHQMAYHEWQLLKKIQDGDNGLTFLTVHENMYCWWDPRLMG